MPDRREILHREAHIASLQIAAARELIGAEFVLGRSGSRHQHFGTLLLRNAELRWARAAALLARSGMTLEERREVRPW